VSPQSFSEDPLRLVRGLRFVSELDLEPDAATLAQMHEEAPAIKLVSGERIGGGLAADGMGELSKLLLGANPRKALRLARDTGVLVEVLPEFGPAIGFEQASERQTLTLDEHIFAVVQATADAGDPLAVRLAALLHDLGKPIDVDFRRHARIAARIAADVLKRLRYPERLRRRVVTVVGAHPFRAADLPADPAAARRFMREHGDQIALDLAAHRRADLHGKAEDPVAAAAVEHLRRLLEQERSSPHHVRDLAIGGNELIEVGFAEGPALGRALERLLDDVVEDPGRNTRDGLLRRAGELLGED
jgi:tRNA nucleotidyltransferase/poly(A) polymerase